MIGMLLFPPFHVMSEGHEVMALGYHFGMQVIGNASMDKEMLIIELVTALLIGAIGAYLFHSSE